MTTSQPELILFTTDYFADFARYTIESNAIAKVAKQFSVDSLGDAQSITVIRKFPPSSYHAFVAMDASITWERRVRAFDSLRDTGYPMISVVSQMADIPTSLTLGMNSLIMDSAGIHPFVEIGDNCVIGAGSRLGFGCSIGHHCWISGAVFGESVQVGDGSMIGPNATVAPGVKIAAGSVIGPGTLVTTATNENEVRSCPGSRASRVPSYRFTHI